MVVFPKSGHIYAHTHIQTYTHAIYTLAHTPTDTYIHRHTDTHEQTHTNVHTHTHTFTNTINFEGGILWIG